MIEAEQQQIENEKKRNELMGAYFRLFNSEDGVIVLKDIARFCHRDSSCVCEQSPDALQTMHESGKRRVILRIDSMMKVKENTDG